MELVENSVFQTITGKKRPRVIEKLSNRRDDESVGRAGAATAFWLLNCAFYHHSLLLLLLLLPLLRLHIIHSRGKSYVRPDRASASLCRTTSVGFFAKGTRRDNLTSFDVSVISMESLYACQPNCLSKGLLPACCTTG